MADIGVRGFGDTPAQAFEQAACALTAVITNPADVRANTRVQLTCRASDMELLFADWLNTLVFEMATRRMLFSRFQVSIADQQLTASAWGEAIDRPRHQPVVEVKGATYTELAVRRSQDGGWVAQCVVDV